MPAAVTGARRVLALRMSSRDRRFTGRSPRRICFATGSKPSPLGRGIDAACTILPVRRKPVGATWKVRGTGSKGTCRPPLWHDFVTVLPCRRRSHRTLAGAIVAGAGDATDEIRRHRHCKAAPVAASGADRACDRPRNKILASQRSAVVRFQPSGAATAGRAGHKTWIFLGVGVSAVRSPGKIDQFHVAVEPDSFERHDS